MMSYLKTDDESFVKDGSSGAVLNTNNTAFQAFKRQREDRKNNEQLKQDVEKMKTEMLEIKELLKMIAERV